MEKQNLKSINRKARKGLRKGRKEHLLRQLADSVFEKELTKTLSAVALADTSVQLFG